jgi:GxxExxY protein
MKDDDLTQKIIGCAYKVHNTLGPGFLEKVYENALRIELEKQGLEVRQQEPINVTYDGQVVGEYYADLWVDERIVPFQALKLSMKTVLNTRTLTLGI